MSLGRPWIAMELAKIHKFYCQLQVSAARVSHFLDAETFASSITVHGRPWDIDVP